MNGPKYKSHATAQARLQWHDALICLLLLAAISIVYSQVRSCEFVNYDDRNYISENNRVRSGLSFESIRWAFASTSEGNWIPLTWLSHMASYRMFGMDAGSHHLVNVFLHALSTLLLFALLAHMTGARWRSAAVAFLFALHPLHVESVAWIAERKDVLSAFFALLTLWAYLRYAGDRNPGRYLLALVFFSLGLMSKSMLVTLPFVLLLLDYWPLGRFQVERLASFVKGRQRAGPPANLKSSFTALVVEKVPFFVLAAVVSGITFVAQGRSGAVASLAHIPFAARLSNAAVSYITYIKEMFWPARLAVFYPYHLAVPLWQPIGAALALAGISALALIYLRRIPYLAVGWFWYAGMLVPVIGLVQVGMQAHADRYTYLPLVGLFIILAWGLADLAQRFPGGRRAFAGIAAAACLAYGFIAWRQIGTWRDSRSLFQRAVEVTADNPVAHSGLGIALQEENHLAEAEFHYREAIRLQPDFSQAHANLGDLYLAQGRLESAIEALNHALRIDPAAMEARINLGIAYSRQEKLDQAISQLEEAVRRNPDSANAHYNLGTVYAKASRISEAVASFSQAIRLQPDIPEAHYNLGAALAGQGNMTAAAEEFSKAIQLKPDYASAHNNLGSALAYLGRIDEAIAHFTEALRLMPDSPEFQRNLEYARSLKK